MFVITNSLKAFELLQLTQHMALVIRAPLHCGGIDQLVVVAGVTQRSCENGVALQRLFPIVVQPLVKTLALRGLGNAVTEAIAIDTA